MNFKNRLIILVCRLLSIKKNPTGENRRILIAATTALGDTLWATPAIESLRKSFPKAFIAALTSPIGYEILKTNPFLDRIYPFKEPLLFRFFSLRKKLKKEKFDTVLVFHTSQRLALPLCATIGASKIIGTFGINKGLDSLLTDPMPSQYEHEILRRLRMVEKIGGNIYTETLSFFSEKNDPPLPNAKWIAIHPGSKDSFKRWPIQHFADVANILQEKTGCRILITGTKDERKLMEETASKIPNAKLMEENLSLHEFANLLNRVDLLISNDTGPVHLACAMNRPVIAIYGATDPHLCGPHKAKRASVISKGTTCTPCLKRECPIPFCLWQTGPGEVALLALERLSNI